MCVSLRLSVSLPSNSNGSSCSISGNARVQLSAFFPTMTQCPLFSLVRHVIVPVFPLSSQYHLPSPIPMRLSGQTRLIRSMIDRRVKHTVETDVGISLVSERSGYRSCCSARHEERTLTGHHETCFHSFFAS